MFLKHKDISSSEVLTSVGLAAGLTPEFVAEVKEQMGQPATKQRLKAYTDEAVQHGVSFFSPFVAKSQSLIRYLKYSQIILSTTGSSFIYLFSLSFCVFFLISAMMFSVSGYTSIYLSVSDTFPQELPM